MPNRNSNPVPIILWHYTLHLPFQVLKGVSHFKLPLGRCRGTGGCCSYTVAGRAIMSHLRSLVCMPCRMTVSTLALLTSSHLLRNQICFPQSLSRCSTPSKMNIRSGQADLGPNQEGVSRKETFQRLFAIISCK